MAAWQSHRFGPEVPQEVIDKVAQVQADLESGTIVTFAGPIKDQDGNDQDQRR